MMVELMAPQPTDRICDPACGTAGFLIESYDYLLRKYSSPAGTHTEIVDGETVTLYSGDLLQPHRQHGHRQPPPGPQRWHLRRLPCRH